MLRRKANRQTSGCQSANSKPDKDDGRQPGGQASEPAKRHTAKQRNMRAGEQASRQRRKRPSTQAVKLPSGRAGGQAARQAGAENKGGPKLGIPSEKQGCLSNPGCVRRGVVYSQIRLACLSLMLYSAINFQFDSPHALRCLFSCSVLVGSPGWLSLLFLSVPDVAEEGGRLAGEGPRFGRGSGGEPAGMRIGTRLPIRQRSFVKGPTHPRCSGILCGQCCRGTFLAPGSAEHQRTSQRTM